MRKKGTITRWDDDKGFGFISLKGDDGSVFVHIKAFGRRDRRPQVGDLVSYRLSQDERGRPRAEKVRFSEGGFRGLVSGLEYLVSLVPMLFTILFMTALFVGWHMGFIPRSILVVYLVASIVTYLRYWWDKSSAQRGRRRTAESTLHFLGLACGWPGAFTAQRILRHKSIKTEFLQVFWFTVFLNVALLAYLVWSGKLELVDQFLVRLWEWILQRAEAL